MKKNIEEDAKNYTRDVGENMFNALNDKNKFAPFVEFVCNNPAYELALCFRGNDYNSDDGKVVIYKNNHRIWDLFLLEGTPNVVIHLNHARFMLDWKDIIKDLMKLGFEDFNGRSYTQLDDKKAFVVRHKSKDYYTYDAISLRYIPRKSSDIADVVSKSYILLEKMQKDFFKPAHMEPFIVTNNRTGKTKEEKRPKNFLKEYFLANNINIRDDDKNHNLYATIQKCEEKHLQQALFLNNHRLANGLFIYDLEFSQPKIPGMNIKSKNEPDMFGIRFDKNGDMEAICMIEVKCTWPAFTGESGLEKHLIGMEDYICNKRLMDDRKEEACRILNRYYALGLYGINHKYEESDFHGLKREIIFIFTNDFPLEKRLHKKPKNMTIQDAIPRFEKYNCVFKGNYKKGVYAMKKEYKHYNPVVAGQ